ncbi:excitatory amino acid transporter 3-like isoform X2 [Poeciliopsis prolifica]|uniref:excitatory amino acid transporter 3-like isoform X2 n=1 Tax=Poeciliopsis prolifica TaxID=188132 RepID=UPI0024140E74|nr:excitatory amino acid transporter 3-like isoform X2 [Poeciliopsis prolifica]
MKESLLQAFCMIGVTLGLGLGFLLRAVVPITDEIKDWIKIPGDMLLQMLQMFGLPLIVTSVVAGVTGLNTTVSRKSAFITGGFICGSTLIAVILATFLTLTIQPGAGEHEVHIGEESQASYVLHVILQDLIRNMVPESFFQAFYEQYKTEIVHVKKIKPGPIRELNTNDTETKLIGGYVDGPNMIGLVIWSFTIGILLNRIGPMAKTTLEAIQCLNDAVKIMVNWILWYLPVGVLFLITEHVLDVHDWGAVLKLTKFVGVVMAGKNPLHIFRNITRALTTAFIIASSAAALPITLQCCEVNLKVDKKLCRLMLPILTSINRTATAFYEVSAAIFIAQLHDIMLDVGQLIAIGLCSSIVAFGSAGIPTTGAVTTILILKVVGLPAENAALLIGVEWILDHFITVVNVLVNVFGVVITNHVWHDDLVSLEHVPSIDRVRSITDIELDLSFLDSDEEFVSSIPSSISSSISPTRGHHLKSIVTPAS